MIAWRRIALLLALVCACACSRSGAESAAATTAAAVPANADGLASIPADSPQLSRIQVAAVTTARVPMEVLEAPGRIEADPSRVSRVALPAPGRISRVMVHLGDAVARGAPLMTIDSPDLGATQSAYRQARARVSQARVAESKADADLARARDLFEGRAIAQKEVLAAEAAAAQGKSDVEQAEAAVNESRRKLDIFGLPPDRADQAIVVRAPVSGKVMETTIVAGEYRNDTSAPLMTIADLSSVFMTADVPETQIRLIQPGTDVDVTLTAYPGDAFHAKVARIADSVDPQTRTIRVRSILANPESRFRPDMFGQIRYAADFRDLPVVPVAAIVRDEERTLLYREEARGQFRAVPVQIGTRTGDQVAVVQGLQPGERIVVDGVMLLTRR
jgi:membrane fusion protein, heavy metal efflux system